MSPTPGRTTTFVTVSETTTDTRSGRTRATSIRLSEIGMSGSRRDVHPPAATTTVPASSASRSVTSAPNRGWAPSATASANHASVMRPGSTRPPSGS